MEFVLKNFDTPVTVTRIANVHYFEFTNQYHTVSDSHNFCELVYVDKGKISVFSDNFKGELESGQLIIHQANESHYFLCEETNAPDIIIIGFECDSPHLIPLSATASKLNAEQKKTLSEIIQEGMNVYAPPYDIPRTADMKKKENYPFGADQMIKIKLECLLISIIREPMLKKQQGKGNLSGNILSVCQYIDEHYSEKILLDNLCFLFCTNKTTLCKNFKKSYNITIGEYINNLKIKESKRLLREGFMSITEISQKLGFSSVHYFSKLFKKKIGQSPKEYSETVRAKFEQQ